MGVRRVRDSAYWGMPVGTPIVKGMKPVRARDKLASAVKSAASPNRSKSTSPTGNKVPGLLARNASANPPKPSSRGTAAQRMAASKPGGAYAAMAAAARKTSNPKPSKPPAPAAASRDVRAPTWEELGKPQGPSPVGQVIGHMGGTYERLPGEPRRYRVIAADGRDISARVRTADDARTALRVDAFDRERSEADAKSTWRKTLGAVSGSWSYDTGDVEGFDTVSPQERTAIRDALARWTGDKAAGRDSTRLAEPRVNMAIRGATARTGDVDRDIRALDQAFTVSKTKRSITVYRGFSNGMHILPDDWERRDLKGLEWSTKGFTPTTADDDAAESYVGFPADRGFGIRIRLPKGSPAIAIPDAIGGLDNEGEIVLPRDLTFRVIKDNGAQGDYGNRWLDVEIVSASKPATPAKAAKKAAKKTTAREKFAAGSASRMPNVLTPQDAITRLRGMNDRASGEQLLAKASWRDLVAIADAGNIPHRANDNKTKLRTAIIESLIGRRIDSDAIRRAVRGASYLQ